jgi:hypothetical protein
MRSRVARVLLAFMVSLRLLLVRSRTSQPWYVTDSCVSQSLGWDQLNIYLQVRFGLSAQGTMAQGPMLVSDATKEQHLQFVSESQHHWPLRMFYYAVRSAVEDDMEIDDRKNLLAWWNQ